MIQADVLNLLLQERDLTCQRPGQSKGSKLFNQMGNSFPRPALNKFCQQLYQKSGQKEIINTKKITGESTKDEDTNVSPRRCTRAQPTMAIGAFVLKSLASRRAYGLVSCTCNSSNSPTPRARHRPYCTRYGRILAKMDTVPYGYGKYGGIRIQPYTAYGWYGWSASRRSLITPSASAGCEPLKPRIVLHEYGLFVPWARGCLLSGDYGAGADPHFKSQLRHDSEVRSKGGLHRLAQGSVEGTLTIGSTGPQLRLTAGRHSGSTMMMTIGLRADHIWNAAACVRPYAAVYGGHGTERYGQFRMYTDTVPP
ncbi:hypothetical protein C8F01DRAFT_1287353 [Mycena amicta]|nr:hypothetical protein C8F01DRAFT_1287353 [Mycena amicta]